jgi:hypothetical protein
MASKKGLMIPKVSPKEAKFPGTSNGKTIYVFDANRRKIHKSLENAFDVEIDEVDNPFRLGT